MTPQPTLHKQNYRHSGIDKKETASRAVSFLSVNYFTPYQYKYIDNRNIIPIVRTADPDMEFLEGGPEDGILQKLFWPVNGQNGRFSLLPCSTGVRRLWRPSLLLGFR